MRPRHHGVDGFRVVAGGDASGVVDVHAEARIEPHAVHLLPAGDDLVLCRVHQAVARTEVVELR